MRAGAAIVWQGLWVWPLAPAVGLIYVRDFLKAGVPGSLLEMLLGKGRAALQFLLIVLCRQSSLVLWECESWVGQKA